MKSGTIVILRQPDDSDEFVKAIEDRGFTPLAEPILSIEYLEASYPELTPDTPLIFTSAHGVNAFCRTQEARNNPVYTVGRNTAEKARISGFTHIETAAGTVEDLAELLSHTLERGLITPIYVRAQDVSKDLSSILAKKGIFIREITAYKAIPAEKLSLKLLQSLDKREIKAVALFSGRGGKTFCELIEQYDRAVRLKNVRALCISEAVVQSVSVLPFQQFIVADQPDRYGMMRLLDSISVNEE